MGHWFCKQDYQGDWREHAARACLHMCHRPQRRDTCPAAHCLQTTPPMHRLISSAHQAPKPTVNRRLRRSSGLHSGAWMYRVPPKHASQAKCVCCRGEQGGAERQRVCWGALAMLRGGRGLVGMPRPSLSRQAEGVLGRRLTEWDPQHAAQAGNVCLLRSLGNPPLSSQAHAAQHGTEVQVVLHLRSTPMNPTATAWAARGTHVAKEVQVWLQLRHARGQKVGSHRLGQVWVVQVALLWEQGLRVGEGADNARRWRFGEPGAMVAVGECR